jgi:Tol biopolymer transport system component
VRIGIALLLTTIAVVCTQAALSRDIRAKQPRALLTFALPSGGICAVRADGSRGVRLTPRWPLSGLAWSSDGRYVAFVRATGGRPTKISVADARGRIRWRFGSRWIEELIWAPDGRHIAYVSRTTTGYGLWLDVARRDGSDLHTVVDSGWPPPSGFGDPAWSPDGQRIAFVHGLGHLNVYSVRLDGSNRQLLVENATSPAYSPNGTKLAYVGYGVGNGGVFVANADGSDPTRVSSRSIEFHGWGPSWSLDGTRLAFAQLASPEVVVARADGSGERVIADLGSSWVRSAPQWSPDGKLVAFVQSPADHRRVTSSIVVARADGRGWRVIARERDSRRDLHSLAWRPAIPLPTARRAPCRRR